MTMKLSILVCAERKQKTKFGLPHQNQELKPISKVEMENSPISQGSQSRAVFFNRGSAEPKGSVSADN